MQKKVTVFTFISIYTHISSFFEGAMLQGYDLGKIRAIVRDSAGDDGDRRRISSNVGISPKRNWYHTISRTPWEHHADELKRLLLFDMRLGRTYSLVRLGMNIHSYKYSGVQVIFSCSHFSDSSFIIPQPIFIHEGQVVYFGLVES